MLLQEALAPQPHRSRGAPVERAPPFGDDRARPPAPQTRGLIATPCSTGCSCSERPIVNPGDDGSFGRRRSTAQSCSLPVELSPVSSRLPATATTPAAPPSAMRSCAPLSEVADGGKASCQLVVADDRHGTLAVLVGAPERRPQRPIAESSTSTRTPSRTQPRASGTQRALGCLTERDEEHRSGRQHAGSEPRGKHLDQAVLADREADAGHLPGRPGRRSGGRSARRRTARSRRRAAGETTSNTVRSVVVEAAHEARVAHERRRRARELRPDAASTCARGLGAQRVADRRRSGRELLAARHLAVEHAQRVLLEAALAVARTARRGAAPGTRAAAPGSAAGPPGRRGC